MVKTLPKVICFIALSAIAIALTAVSNADSDVNKNVIYDKQNDKKVLKKQPKQTKQVKKKLPKTAIQKHGNAGRKKVAISKDVKNKLNNNKRRKAVKVVSKLSFEVNYDTWNSDKVINDLIDERTTSVFLKHIPVSTKNKGVPKVCLLSKPLIQQETAKISDTINDRKSDLKNHIKYMLRANNIDDDLTNRIVKNLHHIKKTIVKNTEFLNRGDEDFLKRYDIPVRIKKSLLYKDIYQQELGVLENAFHVNMDILLTIWSMETNFGENIGRFNAFNALYSACMNATTMARIDYFEKNLILLAKFVQDGFLKENVISSFDGGLGGCQFMPDSFYKYGVAYNGGKVDIIGNNLDVLASIANYFNNIGWRYNEGVLTEIILPDNFEICNIGMNTRKTIAEWKALGVKPHDNGIGSVNLINEDSVASIIVLDINKEDKELKDKRAFFVYDNFKVILGYNQHIKYVITAGLMYEYLMANAMRS